jgi:hypothetical protein
MGLMHSRGAFESLPEFLWRIVMILPEFNLFSDKSARIFLIFPSICLNFRGFPKKFLGGKLLTACSKLVDGLLTNLLQDVRFLRV